MHVGLAALQADSNSTGATAHAQIGKVALQDDAIPQLLNLQLQDEPEVLTEWSERYVVSRIVQLVTACLPHL